MKCEAIWLSKHAEKELPPCDGELFRIDDDTIACEKCEVRFDKS